MKCFVLAWLFPLATFSQTVYDSIPFNESGKASFERVFEFNGTKDSLFDLTKAWASTLLKKTEKAAEDRAAGTILFSSNIDFNHPQQYVFKAANWKSKEIRQNDLGGATNLRYTVKMRVEANKAEMVIEDLSYKRSFASQYNDFDKNTVEAIRNYPVKNLEDQANVGTMESLYRGILQTVTHLQEMFLFHMTGNKPPLR